MKDDTLYLVHMVEHARKVRDRVSRLDRSGFDADEDVRLALTHLIQVIGEAARLVTPTTRAKHPALPWTLVTGMRHRIVHDYVHINYDVVWQTAITSIPALLAELEPTIGPIIDGRKP